MRKPIVTLTLVVIALAFFSIDPVLAAPGGKIAKAVFESFWGRIALLALVIVFAPIIILGMLKERRAMRRANADLAHLAPLCDAFRWLVLRERVTECFQRVHCAWRKEDTADAADVMTDWYWQNQQLVCLDEWARQGLVNHCTVKSITSIRPLLVDPRPDAPNFEGSKVVMSITANMQDYLASRETHEVVEGSKKYKDVQSLWTFELLHGKWKVSNIDEVDVLDDYLQLASTQPRAAQIVAASRASVK